MNLNQQTTYIITRHTIPAILYSLTYGSPQRRINWIKKKKVVSRIKNKKNRKNLPVAQEMLTLMSLGPLFATHHLLSIVLVLALFVVIVLRWWDRWESMRRVVMGKEFEIIL